MPNKVTNFESIIIIIIIISILFITFFFTSFRGQRTYVFWSGEVEKFLDWR